MRPQESPKSLRNHWPGVGLTIPCAAHRPPHQRRRRKIPSTRPTVCTAAFTAARNCTLASQKKHSKIRPGSLQNASQRFPNALKIDPGAHFTAKRRPRASKRLPKQAQEPPESAQERPKNAQVSPKRRSGGPRTLQNRSRDPK